MANEEQRRAFASYMGVGTQAAGTSQSQGQPVPQYPGAVANPAHPYLLHQFSGLGVPPAAPTPPPAAASSIASFPQAKNTAGLFQGGYGQHGLPQRPPPLGSGQSSHGHQQAFPLGQGQSYTHIPGSYGARPLPGSGFGVGWQQTDPNAELARRLSGAPQGAMVPTPQTDYYHHQQRGKPHGDPGAQMAVPREEAEVTVPVMLCHTCSHCGRMRSAGFHRNNPVIPGKTLVATACGRCKKKLKKGRSDWNSFTRIRSCTSDEPCDWPREPVYVEIEQVEHRGRRRSRAEVRVSSYSPSRPRVVRRTSSQARLGLGVFQPSPPPPPPPSSLREQTYVRKVRVSSPSPQRAPRYGEVWPPPDVVRMHASRSDNVFPAPPEPLPNHNSGSNEVWPPPDIVRTHSFRTRERSPTRRPSTRIVELSPSPPPARTRSTRVVVRSESLERRPRSRSHSPIRTRAHDYHRCSEEAEARMTAHPRPYRAVSPNYHKISRASDETSSNNDSVHHSRMGSPSRGILKPADIDRVTTDRRQASMRESQQSTHVEIGGPRVHFHSESRSGDDSDRGRTRQADGRIENGDDYQNYRAYARHRVTERSPPAPPLEGLERLRMRGPSPSPRSSIDEEIRVSRARRISPSPPPCRQFEPVRPRQSLPLPRYERASRGPPSPPSPEKLPYLGSRHVSRTHHVESTRSLTPPPPPSRRLKVKEEAEDVTDSDSGHSGEVVEVRRWKGLDDNGRPATFVEERTRVGMMKQGASTRADEFRPMMDRLARDRSTMAGRWQNV